MKKSKDQVKNVTVTLTEPIHEAIKAFAEEKKWNVSLCIREAIEWYLKDGKRKR